MSGDSRNVAQIRVTSSTQSPRRGSGYRVGRDLVLTAAHVVINADQISLTFDADLPSQWTVGAEVAACSGDLALLQIDPPSELGVQEHARFGRVGSRVATVRFEALGFPAWQLRSDAQAPDSQNNPGRYRDAAQVSGSFPTRSSWREGMLELLVDRPPKAMDLAGDPRLAGIESEWDGMSGSAVWAEGRIIGVVSAHVRSEGLGHLRATRLDQLYRQSDESSQKFRDYLRLPASIDALIDVIPISYAESLAFEFASDIREVAPTALFDRERELYDLRSFCLSDESYIWIQASAWSGKTALSSWLALNPPNKVEVIAFFVIQRQIGRADVNAFLDSAIAQLSTYASERDVALASIEEKRRRFGALIERAAAQVVADGRRLTLIVDGLDEDVSQRMNLPSIASVLPARPIPGLNVLITGRPTPLPFDVHSSHPLRTCRVYSLGASAHAKALEIAASQELAGILSGDDLTAIEMLAFLTVSGGGLTPLELQSLTAVPRLHDIKRRLEGALARSLAVHAGYGGERIFLFGHATLAQTAKDHFRDEEHVYASRLHTWANEHINSGWSESTPQFLLTRYFRLLSTHDSHTVPRMVELAISRERHDLMRARTNGDWDALAEVEISRAAIQNSSLHQLEDIARLSVEHDRLTERNASLPLESGPLWARMGDTTRARKAADLIARREEKSPYLARVSAAIADTGDLVQAKEVAEEIPDFRGRLISLSNVGAKFARRQDYKSAAEISEYLEANARAFPDRGVRAAFLAHAATCFSLMGNNEHAEELGSEIEKLLGEINRPRSPYEGSVAIVARLATIGQIDRGLRISRQISDTSWQWEAQNVVAHYMPESQKNESGCSDEVGKRREFRSSAVSLMRTAVRLRSRDPDLASEILSRALAIRPISSGSDDSGEPAIDAAVLNVFANGWGLRSSAKPAEEIKLFCNISRVLSQEGRHDEALNYAKKAEAEAAHLSVGIGQYLNVIDIADAYLAAGSLPQAKDLVRQAEEIARQDIIRSSSKHWTTVAVALAGAGHSDCAEIIVNRVHPLGTQADEARLRLVSALTDAGHMQKALAVTRTMSTDRPKLEGLLQVAAVLRSYCQDDAEEEALEEAYAFAIKSHNIFQNQPVVASLLEQMSMVGRARRAEGMASRFGLSEARSAGYRAIARAAARGGEFDDALRFTAKAYLETNRSRSPGIDASGVSEIAESIREGNLQKAFGRFRRLDDQRLRIICAQWIVDSKGQLDKEHRNYLLKATTKGSPEYVHGLGRALLGAGFLERLGDVLDHQRRKEALDQQSRQGESNVYRQALIETFEEAVRSGRRDAVHEFLATKPWPDGSLIFAYCLAANSDFSEAWSVLRSGEELQGRFLEQRVRDASFLDPSIYHDALISILGSSASKEDGDIFHRLLPLFRGAGVDRVIQALLAHLSHGDNVNKQLAELEAVLTETDSAIDRVEILWRSIQVLAVKSDPQLINRLVSMALAEAATASDDAQAIMLGHIPMPALETDMGKSLVLPLCKRILSGKHWPYALRALAGIDADSLTRIARDLTEICPVIDVDMSPRADRGRD